MKSRNDKLIMAMIEFDKGAPDLIHHFIKVFEFAHLIGVEEGMPEADLKTLESAAILHDIGILPTEKKFGHCNGKMQEEYGPAYAIELLRQIGDHSEIEMERICYLIAHHHTYSNVDGLDYQILLEADFLVNALENELDCKAIAEFRNKVFKTETGTHLLNTLFDLN